MPCIKGQTKEGGKNITQVPTDSLLSLVTIAGGFYLEGVVNGFAIKFLLDIGIPLL